MYCNIWNFKLYNFVLKEKNCIFFLLKLERIKFIIEKGPNNNNNNKKEKLNFVFGAGFGGCELLFPRQK